MSEPMTDLLTDTELAEIERLTKLHIGDRPPWGNTILRLVGEVMRLRAAEQPPTPPAGRGEERERIEEIRKRWKRADGFRVVDSGELFTFVDDLLAAVDSRDAVIAALVTVMERANAGELEYGEYEAALEAARPFTKETR